MNFTIHLIKKVRLDFFIKLKIKIDIFRKYFYYFECCSKNNKINHIE